MTTLCRHYRIKLHYHLLLKVLTSRVFGTKLCRDLVMKHNRSHHFLFFLLTDYRTQITDHYKLNHIWTHEFSTLVTWQKTDLLGMQSVLEEGKIIWMYGFFYLFYLINIVFNKYKKRFFSNSSCDKGTSPYNHTQNETCSMLVFSRKLEIVKWGCLIFK